MKKPAGNEIHGITLLELLTLYVNVVKARRHPAIGYLDSETPFSTVRKKLNDLGTQIKSSELEAALWACVMLDEEKEFWHPDGLSFQTFMNKLVNARKTRKNFHLIYCYLLEKAGKDVSKLRRSEAPPKREDTSIRARYAAIRARLIRDGYKA